MRERGGDSVRGEKDGYKLEIEMEEEKWERKEQRDNSYKII